MTGGERPAPPLSRGGWEGFGSCGLTWINVVFNGDWNYNTFNAHRLLHWAKQFNKQTELKLALFGLYFTHGGNPGSAEQLVKTAASVGLPSEEEAKIIESDQYTKEVRAEEAQHRTRGISMVPTFIINDKHVITGGLPVEEFVAKLEQIIAVDETSFPNR